MADRRSDLPPPPPPVSSSSPGTGKDWRGDGPFGGDRGFYREPFEEGHELSLRHGADSPRVLRPLAERIERDIRDAAPWTSRPAFLPALRSLCWVEAALELRRRWADEHGLVDEKGRPTAGDGRRDRDESRAAKLREALALTPQSFARLLSTVSAGLRDARAATVDPDVFASVEGAARVLLGEPPAPDEPDEDEELTRRVRDLRDDLAERRRHAEIERLARRVNNTDDEPRPAAEPGDDEPAPPASEVRATSRPDDATPRPWRRARP